MSQLLARILLSVFIVPLAALVYLMAFVVVDSHYWMTEEQACLVSGGITWLFMIVYWLMLWRRTVVWTSRRSLQLIGCTIGSAVVAWLVGMVFFHIIIYDEIGYFLASITAPILWLTGTVVIWRETKQERADRLRDANSDAVVCPTCGYNLTGLTESRCPECGSKFTLNDLLAAQPARKMAEIEQG